jgi:hypothetical protein
MFRAQSQGFRVKGSGFTQDKGCRVIEFRVYFSRAGPEKLSHPPRDAHVRRLMPN